jgi:hypothetical protein
MLILTLLLLLLLQPDHYSPGYGKEYKHYAPSPAYPPYGGYGGYEHKPYEHGYSE